ncbi:hypothetical protein NC796_05320 [Aliifodinibius sp. S!AR15-10]|uniref:hypothetical protein n=1 Tax=Aliifodinibius sp. S!AR15-10 TaxID=2950437 RepID=UPI00285A30EC|nr:hypothetical protein [Aliifodinibius sp. S!AR15-10]MDR8390551.1 hypothetical protein [Aliifodinibius sp. S!AR15-10]
MTFENYGSRLKFNNFLLHNNGGWENALLTQHYKSSYTMISAEESILLFNDLEHFDFSLPDASPYLTGGQSPGDSWFEQVEYHGALGPIKWPWARWPK